MDNDKRTGLDPIPEDIGKYMTDEQITELHKIEGFGWKLHFIRRPLFQEVTVVVVHADGRAIGILEDDGRLNLAPDIDLRN